ncbi:MAG: Hsp33 family molecular chaperone HslO [Oceanospirillaceae bacterium]|nr:Hsp33 family molecular chaperone HslO [Oceanospirillaceae bacterium]
MSNPDQIQRVLFEKLDIRGVLVGLEEPYRQVLERHDYPPVVQRVLGEMLAAVSLLASTLKFEGRLVLQAAGEGTLTMLMAECNHQHDLRALARFEGEVPDDAPFSQLLTNGRLAITIEPEQGRRYQGVVPLEGDSLARCLEAYFNQSEQLPTQVHLAADGERAAGLLLQVMPAAGTGEDDWSHISQLGATLTAEELLQLDNEKLLYRLFHEEECRLYDAEKMRFHCDCSRERSGNALQFLTEEELLAIVEEEGEVGVSCQFCNQHYGFDEADIRTMFSESANVPRSDQIH